jgi:hypothetical protein
MKTQPIYSLKYLFSVLLIFIFLTNSCEKSTTVETVDSNSSISSGVSGTVGSLLMNIKWSKPSLIIGCGTMAIVDVEINGATSNFSQTYSQSPVRIDKRLSRGNYTYTIKKRPVSGCSNFSPIIKTGTFSILACPTICGNPTNLSFTLD